MNIPDGQEPAFPFFTQGPTTGPETYYGMTLRDYFAALCMMGQHASGYPGSYKDCARVAYANADAMLEARKK